MVKEKNKFKIVIIILVAAIVVVAVGGYFLLRALDRGSEQPSGMLPEQGDAAPLKEFDPFPMLEKSGLDASLFYSEGAFLRYPDCQVGVDVSSWQGEVDWQKVSSAGADFALLQLGYRGFTEGGLFADETFEQNYTGATEAGLSVGVYFFSQATSRDEAAAEAEFVLDTLAGRDLGMPVFFDWEYIESEARTDAVTGAEMTDFALAFCDRIELAGYTPGVYFSLRQGYESYDMEKLDGLRLWLAEYSGTPSYLYKIHMWQHTASGAIDGIEGEVDMNILF